MQKLFDSNQTALLFPEKQTLMSLRTNTQKLLHQGHEQKL